MESVLSLNNLKDQAPFEVSAFTTDFRSNGSLQQNETDVLGKLGDRGTGV